MWIRVRSMDGRKCIRVDGLSKLTKVEDLREKLVQPFDAACEDQRLFYRGKQMVDGHTLFDYSVGLNEIIQILVQGPVDEASTCAASDDPPTGASCSKGTDEQRAGCSTDADDARTVESTYRAGDIVDARDEATGAWFEAVVERVYPNRRATEKPVSRPTSSSGRKDEEDGGIDAQKSTKVAARKAPGNGPPSGDGGTAELGAHRRAGELPCRAQGNAEKEDSCLYNVRYEGYYDETAALPSASVRPRSHKRVPLSRLRLGDRVLVNYNLEDPRYRGDWYDAVVSRRRNMRTSTKELEATIFAGEGLVPIQKCRVTLMSEVFQIESPASRLEVNRLQSEGGGIPKRAKKAECVHCFDDSQRRCKFCACCVCGDRKEPEKQVICDECDSAYHLYCLRPPLADVPDEDEWYCPGCRVDASDVVQAGEKLKESRRKSRMASAKSTGSRDWGKGMACVGRTKQCSIVPPNHYGAIPGVEVGCMWKFRVQVSEAGVHRPHVAGIHGREGDGAYSIVMSGGYEDDQDDGEEFTYTGSGGRDLSGNKRTAEQSCDQTLTRMNRALAMNCKAAFDARSGAVAEDWRAGKPVRVIRNWKASRQSEYAPKEGNRYDGTYKVVSYWPSRGKSGFLVWRYLLRRDDAAPAPWTAEGVERARQLGQVMQHPDGWLRSNMYSDEETGGPEEEGKKIGNECQNADEAETPKGKGKGKGKGKRKRTEDEEDADGSGKTTTAAAAAPKKHNFSYDVGAEARKLISRDKKNERLWNEAMTSADKGVQCFMSKVQDLFVCVCCQEVVYVPVTTDCLHNLCKGCLERSFEAEVFSCPVCRSDLGKAYRPEANAALRDILKSLFKGYESGR